LDVALMLTSPHKIQVGEDFSKCVLTSDWLHVSQILNFYFRLIPPNWWRILGYLRIPIKMKTKFAQNCLSRLEIAFYVPSEYADIWEQNRSLYVFHRKIVTCKTSPAIYTDRQL
jgi:hypothetical protein